MGLSRWIQEAIGVEVAAPGTRRVLESLEVEVLSQRKQLDLLGWSLWDATSLTADVRIEARRSLAKKAKTAWMVDPMAGAAVDLLNDFVFGRGVPAPRARDPEVQDVLDEFWNDPDNKVALTTYPAQVALGTDLSLQSNVFFHGFDDGGDGMVKITLMPHDWVVDVVKDQNNLQRVLYYVVEPQTYKWDFDADRALTATDAGFARAARGQGGLVPDPGSGGRGIDARGTKKKDGGPKRVYYPHWSNLRELDEKGIEYEKAPDDKLGKGWIYHIAVNRMTDMVFGVPEMQRTLRWMSSYNDFVAARVDVMKAAAALIMKRKVKGTAGQVQRMAQQTLTRRGELGSGPLADTGTLVPPANASIVTENESSTLEPFKLDSGAGNAAQDGQMVRAQISAATRWPQHYLGDVGAANLAGSTALELPVQKHVEARQELFEGFLRAMQDRQIERAVETGRLDKSAARPKPSPAGDATNDRLSLVAAAPNPDDEADSERDLSYEFSMPSPLRRMMLDLVQAVASVATTFDPNNTNLELSRTLLTIVLGEAFEMQDPSDAVERIFPEGYMDPAVAAAQAQAAGGDMGQGGQGGGAPGGPGELGPGSEGAPTGGDGQSQATNPYGAPMSSPAPEQRAAQQAVLDEGELDEEMAAIVAEALRTPLAHVPAEWDHAAGNGNGAG